MAIGDDAIAAGMSVVDGSTVQADDIDLEINRTRDYIAQRTNAVTPISKGGTNATDAAAARSNLSVPSIADLATKANVSHVHDRLVGSGTGKLFAWRAVANEWNTANNLYVGGYLNVIGTIYNPSSERFKDNITPAPELVGIFPQLMQYERNGVTELGYIAEALVGTDAERFLKFDADGRPEAIAYVALLTAQVAQLAARVAELEANR